MVRFWVKSGQILVRFSGKNGQIVSQILENFSQISIISTLTERHDISQGGFVAEKTLGPVLGPI